MFDKFINRYVRHSLSAVAGFLVAKGLVDAETAGATVETVVTFAGVVASGGLSIILSKISDRLKL